MFKADGRVRELFRKYGKTALATHLAVYAVSFSGERSLDHVYAWLLNLVSKQLTLLDVAGLYVAIENHFDPHSLLIKYGLLSGTALHALVSLMCLK